MCGMIAHDAIFEKKSRKTPYQLLLRSLSLSLLLLKSLLLLPILLLFLLLLLLLLLLLFLLLKLTALPKLSESGNLSTESEICILFSGLAFVD